MSAKTFRTGSNIGKARHTVFFHDGRKTHPDGSPFYDLAIFSNKRKRGAFLRSLERQGYIPE